MFTLDKIKLDNVFDNINGHLIEFVGDTDSYKTTIALEIAKKYLDNDDSTTILYINLKEDISNSFLDSLKIDKNRFYVVLSNNYNNIYKAINDFGSIVDLIIIDPIANIYQQDNKESYRLANKLIYLLSEQSVLYNTGVLIINQIISKMDGTKGTKSFVENTLNKYCSLRLLFEKSSPIVKHYLTVGYKVKVSPIRSKIGLIEETIYNEYF